VSVEHDSVQPKVYSGGAQGVVATSPVTQNSELDSGDLATTQYSALTQQKTPTQGVAPKPFLSPTISELPVSAPTSELPVSAPTDSTACNTLTERSRSPSEWNEHGPENYASGLLETDMHGFLVAAPGPAAPHGRSYLLEQQQKQVKEEKARLTRLQELSEMEVRLEEQLQRELREERR